jgi:predicted restriction endonuclease
MSYLSPVAEEATARVIAQIERVRLGKQAGRRRPHKLLMLLAVAELYANGTLTGNRIYFDDDLKHAFTRHFEQYKKDNDLNQPAQPFFHLRSADFWNHKVKAGKELSYSMLDTSGGGVKRIRDHIEYAFLSDEAFATFNQADSRERIVSAVHSLLEQQ